MPAEVFGPGYAFLPKEKLMTLDELRRMLRAFVALGVEKVRITGGEPLVRGDVAELVKILKGELGVPDVALTTNGWFLAKYAAALKTAGLDRLNVSVDSLQPERFAQLSGRGMKLERVLGGIEEAARVGFPMKLNMVVQRGVNDDEIVSLAAWARERGHTLRFIEFMDVGNHNGWQMERVVPAAEVVRRVSENWVLIPAGPLYRGEVAARYRYADGRGEIGVISSVTEPFCKDCNRARLSADGKLHTCLFTGLGWDVLGKLRGGAGEAELAEFLRGIWGARADRYSDERAELLARGEVRAKAEMSYLGG